MKLPSLPFAKTASPHLPPCDFATMLWEMATRHDELSPTIPLGRGYSSRPFSKHASLVTTATGSGVPSILARPKAPQCPHSFLPTGRGISPDAPTWGGLQPALIPKKHIFLLAWPLEGTELQTGSIWVIVHACCMEIRTFPLGLGLDSGRKQREALPFFNFKSLITAHREMSGGTVPLPKRSA